MLALGWMVVECTELARGEGQARAEAVGRCDEQCLTIVGPGQISKGSIMQVADNTEGSGLLGVIDMDSVLGSDSIHKPIR